MLLGGSGIICMIFVGHASWVANLLEIYRSCTQHITPSQHGRLGSVNVILEVDDLDVCMLVQKCGLFPSFSSSEVICSRATILGTV